MFDRFIVQPLSALLVWLNEFFAGWPLPESISSWAMALIAIAVLVKLVTYRLTASQMRSMRALQELQPKVRALQKQHKNDREALAQKQMELYREHGVNPFGGCLPLLIQMPVLFGLFRAISQNASVMAGANFLMVDDLSVQEPLPWTDPAGIPFLLITLVVTQYAYQKYMTPPAAGGDAQAEMMASMTKVMPLLFAVFFHTMPAGVLLYYTAFNVVSVAQHAYLQRELGPRPQQLVVGDDDNPDPTPAPDTAAGVVAATTQERTVSDNRKSRGRRKKGR